MLIESSCVRRQKYSYECEGKSNKGLSPPSKTCSTTPSSPPPPLKTLLCTTQRPVCSFLPLLDSVSLHLSTRSGGLTLVPSFPREFLSHTLHHSLEHAHPLTFIYFMDQDARLLLCVFRLGCGPLGLWPCPRLLFAGIDGRHCESSKSSSFWVDLQTPFLTHRPSVESVHMTASGR